MPSKDRQKEDPSSVRSELHSFERWKEAKEEELRRRAAGEQRKKREEEEKRAEVAAKALKVFEAWKADQDAKLLKRRKKEKAREEEKRAEKMREENEKKVAREKVGAVIYG
jgi:hypothetical protein